jgi:hypothetical protein
MDSFGGYTWRRLKGIVIEEQKRNNSFSLDDLYVNVDIYVVKTWFLPFIQIKWGTIQRSSRGRRARKTVVFQCQDEVVYSIFLPLAGRMGENGRAAGDHGRKSRQRMGSE